MRIAELPQSQSVAPLHRQMMMKILRWPQGRIIKGECPTAILATAQRGQAGMIEALDNTATAHCGRPGIPGMLCAHNRKVFKQTICSSGAETRSTVGQQKKT
jgi:hypothetical protein